METWRASVGQIQTKIFELCGGRKGFRGIEMIKSLLAFLLAGNFACFKRATFQCVRPCVRVCVLEPAHFYQAAFFCKLPSDLEMGSFLYIVIWGKYVLHKLRCVRLVLFYCTSLTLPEKDQFGESLKFLFLHHETGARRTNTHRTVRRRSPLDRPHASLWRPGPILQ